MFKRWFHRQVLRRRWLTFLVMVLSFFCFGMLSFNLFFLMKANLDLLTMHGWQAAMDGGLAQAVELSVSGLLAMAAYVVFKTCEHRLVHWLAEPDSNETLK